jgi:hypothetical protein
MSRDDAVAFVEYVRHQQAELPRRVAEAYAGRAWVALGYESWESMCEGEDLALRLPRGERSALVMELTDAGLSARAIAPVVGVNRKTVDRDVRGGTNDPPAEVTGLDGKTYRRPDPKPDPPPPSEWSEQMQVESERRAARANLDRLLLLAAPVADITADQFIAGSRYPDVLAEFDQAKLDMAAEVLTALAQLRRTVS